MQKEKKDVPYLPMAKARGFTALSMKEVPENIKDKIAKLLALSESPNENEAKSALRKAHQMMAEHKLSEEDVAGRQSQRVVDEEVGIEYTEVSMPWLYAVAHIIAENHCCTIYKERLRHGGKKLQLRAVGYEEDFGVARSLIQYAHEYLQHTYKNIKKENAAQGMSATTIRDMLKGYGLGFAEGLAIMFGSQNASNPEWGLVMTVPTDVRNALANKDGMSKSRINSSYRKKNEDLVLDMQKKGIADGKSFNFSRRLDDE